MPDPEIFETLDYDFDILSQRFESRLILAALASTHGRRIEAAHKLGIGRNTITRKMQELSLDWP